MMKKPWFLIGILLMAHPVWAQPENTGDTDPSKLKQRTGVLMSASGPSEPEAARDVLVKTPPYQPPAPSPQAPAVSARPEPAAVKSVTGTGSGKSAPASSLRTQTSVAPKEHEPLTVAKPKAPVTPKQAAPSPKPAEKSSVPRSQNTGCRIGGYIEETMSPEECRRQGGMMIEAAGTFSGSGDPSPRSKAAGQPSLFDSRNLVCRVRGHEKKGLSAEECKKQGGVMITTWDVPTYHKPPANGKFLGEN